MGLGQQVWRLVDRRAKDGSSAVFEEHSPDLVVWDALVERVKHGADQTLIDRGTARLNCTRVGDGRNQRLARHLALDLG